MNFPRFTLGRLALALGGVFLLAVVVWTMTGIDDAASSREAGRNAETDSAGVAQPSRAVVAQWLQASEDELAKRADDYELDAPRRRNELGELEPFRQQAMSAAQVEALRAAAAGQVVRLDLFPEVSREVRVTGRWDDPAETRLLAAVEGATERDRFSMSWMDEQSRGLLELPSLNRAYEVLLLPDGSYVAREWLYTDMVCSRPSGGGTSADAGIPLPPRSTAKASAPAAIIPALNSRPSAVATIYLDFDGEVVSGTAWSSGTINALPARMNETQIEETWSRVANHFAVFDVNVTTERSRYDAAPANRKTHCVITPTTDAAPGAGGVAYVGSFTDSGSLYKVCWTFADDWPAGAALVSSHEIGHTLNLRHHGRVAADGQPSEDYYEGHGTGETGWGPFLGAPYGKNLLQWSKGEYARANNSLQDDLAIMTTSARIPYIADDHGNTTAVATAIAPGTEVTGRVGTNTDSDFFRVAFGSSGPQPIAVSLPAGTMLDAEMRLYSSTGQLLQTVNPVEALPASTTFNATAGEDVLVEIRGTGKPEVSGTGYSNYSSLGSYTLVAGTGASDSFLETFDTSNATADYADGSFVGVGGITWTYGRSRNEGDYPIEAKGLMFQRASDSYLEAVFPDGVETLTFQYRKAFTGNSSRQLELLVNGVQVATSPTFGTSPAGADPTIFTLSHLVNTPGPVTIRIKLTGVSTTGRQTTIDNVSWTSFGESTDPQITSFTPEVGPVGTSVTINGFNFGPAPLVKFNGLTSVSSVNPAGTVITATVPASATTGPITVEVAGQPTASSAGNFTVGLPPPSVTANPLSITGLNTSEGLASISRFYSLVASNLTGNLIVAPSTAAFEVSTDDVTFGPSVTLTPSEGLVSTTIYVRLAASAPAGASTGAMSNSIAGEATPFASTPTLSGSVAPAGVGELVAGWDFQTTTSGGTAVAAQDAEQPKVFTANVGAGALYLDGSNGSSDWISAATAARELNAFAGTVINATDGLSVVTTSPAALALLNSTANGKVAVFRFSMTGYQGLAISLAAQRTSTGFAEQVWEYSTDGTTWSSIGTLVSGTTAGTISSSFAGSGVLALPATSALDNLPNAYVRVTFNGATAATGNNRIDNIQFRATPASGPRITVSPTSINNLTAVGGSTGTPQQITVTGAELTTGINVAVTSANYEVAVGGSDNFGALATLPAAGGMIDVRIASGVAIGNVAAASVTFNSTSAAEKTVSVSGTVTDPNQPTLSVSPTSLPAFSTTQGTASGAQTFSITAANLNSNIVISPPAGFAVSTDGTTFSTAAITIPFAEFVSPATISVRLTGATQGSPSGNVSVASGSLTRNVAVSGTVGPPPSVVLSVSTSGPISAGTTTQGTVSGAPYGEFRFGGENLVNQDITVTAPDGFEVSIQNASFGVARTAGPYNGSISDIPVRVRIAANAPAGPVSGEVRVSANNAAPATVAVTGTVNAGPTITVDPSVLEPFTTPQGIASTPRSFNLSGSNLTAGNLTVTAPDGFEVSLTAGGSYGSTATLTPTAGTMASTSVFVRIAASAPQGNLALRNVTVAGGGATTRNVSVSGEVTAPVPTITVDPESLSGFETEQGTASTNQIVTVSGVNLEGAITVAAPANYEVSLNSEAGFSDSVMLPPVAPRSIAPVNAEPAVIASDNAGNYGDEALNNWVDGSNEGFGFGPWEFVVNTGTGFAGAFIGNPVDAGITLFPAPAFGLYANPGASGAEVTLNRNFAEPLEVGDIFSFQWGTNWDSDVGNKGFSIFAGETEVVNVNQGGFPGDITINGANTGLLFGPGPMTWTFTVTSAGNLRVTSTARDGSATPVFTTDVAIPSGPTSFRWYVSAMGAGDQRQPYFNNLQITSSGGGGGGDVPETDVFVRVRATAPVGVVEGELQASSLNATTRVVALSGTVNPRPPQLAVDPDTVSGLESFVGLPGSVAGSFAVSGADLVEDVTVAAPENFEVSLSADADFANEINISPLDGAVDSTVYVRIGVVSQTGLVSGAVSLSSTPASASVAVAGEVFAVPVGPTIIFAPEIGVVGLRTTQGTASEPLSVTVNGFNLLGDITASAPAGLEVSLTENGGFGPSVPLVPTDGRVSNVRLYVRIAADAIEGPVDATVFLISDGATDQSLPVLGEVLPQPVISVVPDSLEPFRTVVGLQPPPQSLSVSGTSLAGPVTVTVPTGYQFFVNGVVVAASSFTPATAGNFQIDVVLTAIDQPGTPGGDMTFTSQGAVPVVVSLDGLVLPRPVVDATPAEITGLVAREGFPSEAPGEFVVSGLELLEDLLVTAPAGFELSLDGADYAAQIALQPELPGAGPAQMSAAALDTAANYSGSWVSGSNGGTGFAPWVLTDNSATTIFSGFLLADSTAGAGDINTGGQSFALYANPGSAFADADRNFAAPMSIGDRLTFLLAVNFDNGNKGFDLYTGGAGVTQLMNFNLGGGASVSAGSGLVLTPGSGQDYDYGGTAVLSVSITCVSPTELSYSISRTSPLGNQGVLFSGTITSTEPFGAPDGIRFYNSGTGDGANQNNLYFNNLAVAPPPPSEGGTVPPTTVYVRIDDTAPLGPISGFIDVTSGIYAEPRTVAVAGDVIRPEVLVDSTNLNPFVAAEGQPSPSQFIVVSGSNLVNPITITAPANYEVSRDGPSTGFAPLLSLVPQSGTVDPTLIYIRIVAGAPPGNLPAAALELASAGSSSSPPAVTQTVPLTGSVQPWPVINPLSLRVLLPAAAVTNTNESFAFAGQAGVDLTNAIRWSNSLTGQTNSFARADDWAAEVPLAVGTNLVTFRTTYRTYDTSNVVRVAFDTPDSTSYLGGWTNGSSGGFGFAAWQLSASGTASNFRTTSATNLSLIKSIAAFTLRGGAGLDDAALARRRLEAPLVPASSFEIELDSNDLALGGSLGVALAAGTNSQVRFYAEATTGQPTVFQIEDAAGLRTETIPYTTGGFIWRFQLLSPTNYLLTVTPNSGAGASSIEGTLTEAPIDTWVMSNRAGGTATANNFYAGRMQVHSPSFTDTTVTVVAPIVVRTEQPEPPADDYADWADSFGLDPETDGAPEADPDGDDFSNALEFAFGTNPTQPTGSLLETESDGVDLVVRYAERITGVTYTVKTTGNLLVGPWVDADVEVEPVVEPQGVPDGYRMMQFRVRASGNAFYRVEASWP